MSDVVSIGRTLYYSVRKGSLQYCVESGKKIDDPVGVWLVQKDPASGKPFYVNNAGVRRWHLPDVYQTEQERLQEQRELRLRREQKADDSKSTNTTTTVVEDFVTRDQAALKLKSNAEWNDADKRKQVFKIAKRALAPMVARGEIDDTLFTTVVATICFEYFHRHKSFTPAEKQQLESDVVSYARNRIEELHKQQEHKQRTADLMAKVKRIDGERKAANSRVTLLVAENERLRGDILALRGHKQDTLMQGFKRLTRAGLVKVYWRRWIVFKSMIDAQLNARARERRALETANKISALETENQSLKMVVEQLENRVKRCEARDAMSLMIQHSGTKIMARYFSNWVRFAFDSIRERRFLELREQLNKCPNCELRSIENSRAVKRMDDAFHSYIQAKTALTEAERDIEHLRIALEEREAAVVLAQNAALSAQAAAAGMSKKAAKFDSELFAARLKQESLQRTIDGLQFNLMTRSDFTHGRDKAGNAMTMVSNALNDTAKEGSNAARSMDQFFAEESEAAAAKLRGRTTARSQAKSKAAEEAENQNSSVFVASARTTAALSAQPAKGRVPMETEAAIAPLVRSVMKPVEDPRWARPPGSPPDSVLDRSSSSSSSSSSSADPESEMTDTDLCDRCGFRKTLTPFCPRDGSRHMFHAFEKGEDPLKRLQPTHTASAYTLHRTRKVPDGPPSNDAETLPVGLPPPEYRHRAVEDVPERSAADISAPPHASIASQLRAGLNLDPSQYDPRRTAMLSSSYAERSRAPEMDRSDNRAIADHVRNTKISVERRMQETLLRGHAVELPAAYVPLNEFRQHSGVELIGLDSGIKLRTTQQTEGARRSAKPSWNTLFSTDDPDSTTFGIGPAEPSVAFGIARLSDGTPQSRVVAPSQRVLAHQRSTPNFS